MGIPAPAGQGAPGTPPAGDQANAVVTGSFTATGTSLPFAFYGAFNVAIWGTWSGSVQLERSFDGGTTWIICGVGGGGQQAVYNAGTNVSIVVSEPEKSVLYRLDCTSFVSGTINYRLSASGLAAMAWGVPGN